MKRIAGLVEAEAKAAREPEEASCPLCGRLLGQRVEQHHVVPKSAGGAQTASVHPSVTAPFMLLCRTMSWPRLTHAWIDYESAMIWLASCVGLPISRPIFGHERGGGIRFDDPLHEAARAAGVCLGEVARLR